MDESTDVIVMINMNAILLTCAFFVLCFQFLFSWIISFAKREKSSSREINEYIKNLYSWLPKITLSLYLITIANKFAGFDVNVPFLNATVILGVTIFATALLSFYPLNLIHNFANKIKPEFVSRDKD